MDYEAFVYLWFDSKNRKFYLGYHKGHEDDSYTHSSTVMESFSKSDIPSYMRRRILARGSCEEMMQLEVDLLNNRKEKCWDKYYNMIAVFPPPPVFGADHPQYIDGRSSDPEYKRKWREKNREKIREQKRQYHEENREKILESSRKYRKKNREKILESSRKYRKKNREKILEYKRQYQRQWRKENREKAREYNQKYREENREKLRESSRKYREENREKVLESKREYRAKKKAEKMGNATLEAFFG